MPGTRLYNFSLAQPQFEVTPFQAVAFEPKEQPNFGLLTNAFEKIEQRETATSKVKADLNTLFSTIDPKLNKDDPETMEWWKNFQKKYKDEIADYVRGGDYSTAIQFATEAAGEAVNDKELLARQYRYETYKKEYDTQKARVNNGISEKTFKWWNKENPFDYEFIRDDEGNVISGKAWNGKPPVNDFDLIKLYATAFQILNPDTITRGSSTSISNRKGVKGITTGSEKSSGYSKSRTTVTPKEVLNVIKDTFEANNENIDSLYQRYEVDKYDVEEMEKEYNNMSEEEKNSTRGKDLYYIKELKKKLLTRNGSWCGAEWYFARLISGMYNSGLNPNETVKDDNMLVMRFADYLGYDKDSYETRSGRGNEYYDKESGGGGSGSGVGTQQQIPSQQEVNQPNSSGTAPNVVKTVTGAVRNAVNKAMPKNSF